MGWYWVAYTIVHSTTGEPTGTGTIEIELNPPPVNVDEILRLADRITDISHDKGLLIGRHVAVLSWSKMGA